MASNSPKLTNELLPEERKTEKKLLLDHQKLEELKKKKGGKLSISDLVVLPHEEQQQLQTQQQSQLAVTPQKDSSWPFELILVRHGESEGNLAVSRSENGDLTAYTPEFKNKHSSTYRLTDKGIKQAKVAGQWIKDNIGDKFDRYYTSEYVRAMETAALLDLPGAQWYTEITLRERDKGVMDNTSAVEKKTLFADDLERRKRDAFYWAPPGGGESLAHVCVRIDHSLNTLKRECKNQRVIIVCHGEVMWAFRVRIERISQIRFHRLQASKDPKDKIHNTQVIHYSRIHPQTGEVFPEFRFMRISCPWKPEYGSDEWLEFSRPTYTNEELLASARTVPRYVNNSNEKEKPDDVFKDVY